MRLVCCAFLVAHCDTTKYKYFRLSSVSPKIFKKAAYVKPTIGISGLAGVLICYCCLSAEPSGPCASRNFFHPTILDQSSLNPNASGFEPTRKAGTRVEVRPAKPSPSPQGRIGTRAKVARGHPFRCRRLPDSRASQPLNMIKK